MKKLLAGLMVLSFLFIGSQVHASTLSDLKAEILSLKEEILNLRSSMMGAAIGAVTKTTDLTPRISYWPGKVNQHIDATLGAWSTDSDGSSGASINKLTYCKKWYPNTISVDLYKTETITTWKNAGNTGGYTASFPSYKCIQGSSSGSSTSAVQTESLKSATTANDSKPNLTISLSNIPSSLKTDTSFKVTTIIKNDSSVAAISNPSGSYTKVSFMPDSLAQSFKPTIPSGSNSIAANGVVTDSEHVLRSADLKSTAYYYIEACADENNLIDESDETDNCTKSGQIKVNSGSNPVNGKWSEWTNYYGCNNLGKQSQVRYCVGALNGGVCIPDTFGSATYRTINCSANTSKPDLVASISYVPNIYVGNSFTINGVLKNTGNAIAKSSSITSPFIGATLEISRTPDFTDNVSYLDLPNSLSTKLLQDYPAHYNPISPNGIINLSFKVGSYNSMTPGTLYFRICADRNNFVEESSESNCSPVSSAVIKQGQTVDSLPDLVVTSVSVPSKVRVNTTTYFTALIKNIGTAPVMSKFNNRFTIIDYSNQAQNVYLDIPTDNDIKSGASTYVYAKHKFTKTGTFGIMVCADNASGTTQMFDKNGYSDEIRELNGGENCSAPKDFKVNL